MARSVKVVCRAVTGLAEYLGRRDRVGKHSYFCGARAAFLFRSWRKTNLQLSARAITRYCCWCMLIVTQELVFIATCALR